MKVVWVTLLYFAIGGGNSTGGFVAVEVASRADCMRLVTTHRTVANGNTGRCVEVKKPL